MTDREQACIEILKANPQLLGLRKRFQLARTDRPEDLEACMDRIEEIGRELHDKPS